MIRKALEYIVGLNQPAIQDINGETYSDKPLNRVSYNPKAEPITMHTLSSFIDYIKSEFDDHDKLFVHVVSPTEVMAYSRLDYERKREYLARVEAHVPRFRFDDFVNQEEFCIALQSKFLNTHDRALLLKFAGTVEAGSVAEYGDDGVTQKATVKTGVASKSDAIVPNPVSLEAYRTFIEVEQPITQYVFRMRQDSNGVKCALFQADGGEWELEAMQNIKEFLDEQLKDFADLVVIC